MNRLSLEEQRRVSDGGQALSAGEDIFSTTIVYGNDILAYGNSFLRETLNVSNVIKTSNVNYALEAVSSVSTTNEWYSFYTDGTSYPTVSPCASDVNVIQLYKSQSDDAVGHSGLIQKLNNLHIGQTYCIKIDFHRSSINASISFSTFYHKIRRQYISNYIQSEVQTLNLPSQSISFDFTAYTSSDILFIDYFSSVSSETNTKISSISVKRKEECLLPVLNNNGYGLEKILKLSVHGAVEESENYNPL